MRKVNHSGPEIWLALPDVRHYSGRPKIGF